MSDASKALLVLILFIVFCAGGIVGRQTTLKLGHEYLQGCNDLPMSFEHRFGECYLSMLCHNCLERERVPGVTSGLSICWEETNMDEHMEIFGR